MGVIKELFSRPLYQNGKMGDAVLPAPAEAVSDAQPTEYGSVPDDLEAMIDADPLNWHNHGVLSDWHRDQGNEDEADFRGAMRDWLQTQRPSDVYNPERAEHITRDNQGRVRPWSIQVDGEYPKGVDPVLVPTEWNWQLAPINPNTGLWHIPDEIADEFGARLWPDNRMYWPTYRGMETALRRAFLAGRQQPPTQASRYERRHAPTGFTYADKPYRVGQFIPGTVLFTHTPKRTPERWHPEPPPDVQPTDYGDVIPVDQVNDPRVLAKRREAGAAKMRRITDRRQAEPVEANASRILQALQTHGPLKRSHLLTKTKVYGQAFQDALAHLGDQLYVERRGAHPNGGGPPTEVWSLRPPAQDNLDVQPTEYVEDEEFLDLSSSPDFLRLPPDPDAQAADLGFTSNVAQQPPPPVLPSDPIPGASPQAPVVMEHLNILQGGAHNLAFPQLARAYLGAIPPAERDAVYRAVGVDPNGPEPHLHLASVIGGPVHHRQNNVGTDPLLAPPPAPPALAGWGAWKPGTDQQDALHHSAVTAEEPVGVRSANQTSKLTFADGAQAIFKPATGERMGLRDGIDGGTQWRREVAASDVAHVLGFGDLVPPTSFRSYGGKDGSAQHYIGGATPANYSTSPSRFDGHEDAARAAVFDYLIGNTDRHEGNWLLNNGKLVLIDHGLSFPHTIDPSDFMNHEFWVNAARYNLPLPDMAHLRERWPHVEQALRTAGIEDDAIALAQRRFDAVTGGRYQTIGQLPAFWTGVIGEPLRDAV